MQFTRQTLVIFQQLLANHRVSVLDQNADVLFQQLLTARNELSVAAQEVNTQPVTK